MFSSVTAVLKERLMRVVHCTVELYFVINTIALILALISSIGASPFYIHYIHTFFCIYMKYNKNMWVEQQLIVFVSLLHSSFLSKEAASATRR